MLFAGWYCLRAHCGPPCFQPHLYQYRTDRGNSGRRFGGCATGAKGVAEEGKCHHTRSRSAGAARAADYSKVRARSQLVRIFSDGVDWSIRDDDGLFKIIGYRKHPKGYWEQDVENEIRFLPGTNVDEVIDRVIVLLQQTALESDKLQAPRC
jgi:hypothetical protein